MQGLDDKLRYAKGYGLEWFIAFLFGAIWRLLFSIISGSILRFQGQIWRLGVEW